MDPLIAKEQLLAFQEQTVIRFFLTPTGKKPRLNLLACILRYSPILTNLQLVNALMDVQVHREILE